MFKAVFFSGIEVIPVNSCTDETRVELPDHLSKNLCCRPAKGGLFSRRIYHNEAPLVIERIECVRNTLKD